MQPRGRDRERVRRETKGGRDTGGGRLGRYSNNNNIAKFYTYNFRQVRTQCRRQTELMSAAKGKETGGWEKERER